ncbi:MULTISPECIES: hypothetical protein [unclassified Streptomyces]|uniref:hypothetical protein n=1 Tax=unclassified Streptomyces TaxID=2593676 RepID=UPI002E19B9D7|nr:MULTISPECIES: hypothetical protein [unclassified Streptomyces]
MTDVKRARRRRILTGVEAAVTACVAAGVFALIGIANATANATANADRQAAGGRSSPPLGWSTAPSPTPPAGTV